IRDLRMSRGLGDVYKRQGPIMRRYRLATLTLYTAGGQAEIELIDRSEARRLKRWLNNERHLENNKNEE
ncbi:PH domain-containing protein, partial [Staphylococcus aureus]|nr:PH domain-containing protein [Staphylococcus aureus]